VKITRKLGSLLALAAILTVGLAVFTHPQTASAANPGTISFQGKVVNADGTNVTGGASIPITFKIYDAASAGTLLWTENDTVTVTNGVFVVKLGAVTTLSTIDFNANPSLYLGITYNGDAAEMSPRPQLQSVPFAFNSDKLGGLDKTGFLQVAPASAQADTTTNTSIFLNKSGASGNLIQLQTGGGTPVTKFTVSYAGDVTAGNYNTNIFNATTLTFGGATTNTISGANAAALTLQSQGTGSLTLASGSGTLGIGPTTSTIQRVATGTTILDLKDGANTVLQLFNSGTGVSNLQLYGGGLCTGSAACTTGGATMRLDNTGNLTNIGAITASGLQTLSLTGGNALAVTGTPVTSAVLSLVRLGSAPLVAGSANGTYLGLNTSSATTADLLNLQNNGGARLNVTSAGQLNSVNINASTSYLANGTAGKSLQCNGGQTQAITQISLGLVVASAACGGLSDRRVKENIIPLDTDILSRLNNVNAVHFNFKCNDPNIGDVVNHDCSLQTGVIAQEIATVFPDLVLYQPGDGYYHVNYQNLGIYTLKGVQQLAQHLDASGNATLANASANSLAISNDVTVGGNLKVNGTLTYNTTQTDNGVFTSSVISPLFTADGALSLDSGAVGNVSIDTGSKAAYVNVGATNATGVNLSQAGQTTTVSGALVIDQSATFHGAVKVDSASTDGLISTNNFSVNGAGDVTTKGSFISKGGGLQMLDANGASLFTIDGSGNGVLAGSLNLASASISGGLTVGGDINVAGLSTFQKLATFIGKTIFRQDVQFDGHITVAADSAGYATLRTTEAKVSIKFKVSYETVPVVTASTSDGQFVQTAVANITKDGFDITVATPATQDTKFSWTAVGANDPQTATNPASLATP
jgi:hypothetical protein